MVFDNLLKTESHNYGLNITKSAYICNHTLSKLKLQLQFLRQKVINHKYYKSFVHSLQLTYL